MILAPLLTLTLPLAGAPAAPTGAGLGLASPAPIVATVDAFTDLVASFEEAEATWKQKLKDTEDLRERAKLRDANPAMKYWPRFESMAEGGEGRALLWMVGHAKAAGTPRAELAPLKERLYTALVNEHHGADWFGGVLEGIAGEKRGLDEGVRDGLLARVMQNEKASAEVRAHATFAMGTLLQASKDEAKQARGKELLRSIPKAYPGTKWAIQAQAASITADDLKPGKLAPDFIGKTIDGHEFKLSDYRGKVVLVDFYGFW